MKKVSLTQDDISILLPGQKYQIGKTIIYVKPLGLQDFSMVCKKLGELVDSWKIVLASEISDEETNDDTKKKTREEIELKEARGIVDLFSKAIPMVGDIVSIHGANILSDMSGIEEEWITQLSLTESVRLLTFCLEVNIKSLQDFKKNFDGLKKAFVEIVPLKDIIKTTI